MISFFIIGIPPFLIKNCKKYIVGAALDKRRGIEIIQRLLSRHLTRFGEIFSYFIKQKLAG